MGTTNLWDLYTGADEYTPLITDRFGRIFSYSVKKRAYFKAEVSEFLFDSGFTPKYPDGKQFGVALSHDIDILFENRTRQTALKNVFRSALQKNKVLFNNSLNSLYKKRVFENYSTEWLRHVNDKYDAKATYFFLSTSPDYPEHNYEPHEVKHLLQNLVESGNEIGLHGSYNAFNNKKLIKDEKHRLETVTGEKIHGYRNHNLNFNIETTYNNLLASDLKYDSTYGFPDIVGFRNGMCYPYYPFNVKESQFYDIVEFPLHVMDITFFGYFMRLDYDKAFDVFKTIVQEVKRLNGVMSFLWHNNNLSGDMLKFYELCLDYLVLENAWITTTNNIYHHYKNNNYFDQIKDILSTLNE